MNQFLIVPSLSFEIHSTRAFLGLILQPCMRRIQISFIPDDQGKDQGMKEKRRTPLVLEQHWASGHPSPILGSFFFCFPFHSPFLWAFYFQQRAFDQPPRPQPWKGTEAHTETTQNLCFSLLQPLTVVPLVCSLSPRRTQRQSTAPPNLDTPRQTDSLQTVLTRYFPPFSPQHTHNPHPLQLFALHPSFISGLPFFFFFFL